MECYECGVKGHKGNDCRNKKFLANRNWKCGCNINQLRQLKFNGPTKTHCCECGKIERSFKMEWHQTTIGKMRCMKCKHGENYDSDKHRNYRNFNSQKERRFERPNDQPFERKQLNFGECINCEKRPTSLIQAILENGLCPKCDQKKENYDRYGSTTKIRNCWTY